MKTFNLNSVTTYGLVVILLLLGSVGVASAQTVLRSQDEVRVSETQVVEGNFYTSGNKTTISGAVQGDWFGFGDSITANGTFAKDILLLGRSIQLHGSTTEDVRVAGLEVVIAEDIGGDLVVVADSVEIVSGASIGGDVLLFANSVKINGAVGGYVLGSAGDLRIDAAIEKGVDVKAQSLVLGGKAVIAGDVHYTSVNKLVRAQDSVVSGEILYEPIVSEVTLLEVLQSNAVPALALLFAVLVMYLFAPRRVGVVAMQNNNQLAVAAMIGFAWLITVPVVVLLFFMSGLGFLVGIMLFALYLLLGVTGTVLSVPIVGAFMVRVLRPKRSFDLLTIIVGIGVIYGLLLVPFIGPALFMAAAAAGVGSLVLYLYRGRR